jgi:hypothetical protein
MAPSLFVTYLQHLKNCQSIRRAVLHGVYLLVSNDSDYEGYPGRAIAQEVSRRLPTAAAGVETRVWSCGIL